MSTPEQDILYRLTEYNALIEIEGYQRRTQRFGIGTYEVDENKSVVRRRRLNELVELLARDGHPLDIDESVEACIDRHPLTMTGAGMKRVIDSTTGQGNGISVGVQVGDPEKSGRYYQLHEGQFGTGVGGTLLLTLPDSIAEEFRQQGRRALQREMRRTLGVD